MGIIGLSQPEDTVSISLLSSTVALTDFLHPLTFCNIFLALRVGIVLYSSCVGKGIPYSLHVDHLWFSGGASICCKKKFL